MGIFDWFDWIFLGLVALQVLGLVPIIRRLRGLDPAVRFTARLDLLDAVGWLLAVGGFLLSSVAADSWLWLSLAGLALMGVGYAVKGVQLLRARHRSAA
ncbi:hypothetical protein ACWCQK_04955 [Streptomyces sp. NPDC002306]